MGHERKPFAATDTCRHPVFVAGLLLFAVAVSYANSFWGAFQFDDFNVIVNNPRIHSWPAWLLDLQRGIRPLLKLTYTADWTWGRGVAAFHFTNVFIHFCNSWLVWALTRRMADNHPALRGIPELPLLAALLFAVHPAHTEAVTYVCGRSIALMTMFYLLGMLAYIEGKKQGSVFYLHLLTPLCMLLALGAKETAVTFPAALLLLALYSGGVKSALRDQWSSWLLLLASAILFLLHDGYLAQVETSASLNSLHGNAATQTMAFMYLLRQWLFPLWPNIDPDLPVLHDFAGLMPQIILATAAAVLMASTFRSRPWLSFALAWAMLHLIPLYLFLPRLDVANDRQLYIVSGPLALALAAELSLRLGLVTFRLGMALLLVFLASLTVLRNQDFYSEVALWQATVEDSPDKARAQNNLGYAYMLAGRTEDARAAFATALRLDPEYHKARYNLLRLDGHDAEHRPGQQAEPSRP